MPEPCENEEAEADSPDMEPGTEMDQGEQLKITSKQSICSFWLTKNSAPSQYKHKLLKLWKCAIV